MARRTESWGLQGGGSVWSEAPPVHEVAGIEGEPTPGIARAEASPPEQ